VTVFARVHLPSLGRATEWLNSEPLFGLRYFNDVDRGGHFAAWEQPELFSAELRAAFRSLRTNGGSS
jgi:pimeloyl-ACP methyl ester carboxylesterase